SLGSGFIIDPSGYIVTNNHVIENSDQITVSLQDGTQMPAKLVGRDTKTDLALLKVTPKKPLPATHFGDSDKARIGDWVIAIGDPFGIGSTVTAGIVSARNRNINAGPYDDFIQTDAPINRGNSGGPLFDMDGDVIGINSQIYTPSGGSVGIGFAIPANLARQVVGQLRQFGAARRGWIGVRIQQVTAEIAEGLSLPTTQGALVADVTKDGPAAKAGLVNGDLIIGFDGKPVADDRVLPRIVADTPIGKSVNIDVLRKGKKQTMHITVQKLAEDTRPDKPVKGPPAPKNQPKVAQLGLVLRRGRPLDRLVGSGVLRQLLHRDVHGLLLALAQHIDVHAFADRRVGDDARQHAVVGDRLAVKADDQIAIDQAGLGGGSILGHVRHQRALCGGKAEALGNLLRHLLDTHADPAAARGAELAQLSHHLARQVGRNGKADADAAAAGGVDLRIDADDIAI